MMGIWPKNDSSLLFAFLIEYIAPLIVGLIFIVFSLSFYILSSKKKTSRFYLKSVALRLLTSFIITAVFGFIIIAIILMLFGSTSTP